MKPKILFSRKEQEDFSQVKEQLEKIIETDQVTIFLEGSFIPVPDQMLTSNSNEEHNRELFLKIYEMDTKCKKNVEANPSILGFFSRTTFCKNPISLGLYSLALEKKWKFKHEIIPTGNLFLLQKNISLYNGLPNRIEFNDEYLEYSREILKNIKIATYLRDEEFIKHMESYSIETDREVISSRCTLHNYLINIIEPGRIEFYGDKGLCEANPTMLILHKNLLGLEITDDELKYSYLELKSKK